MQPTEVRQGMMVRRNDLPADYGVAIRKATGSKDGDLWEVLVLDDASGHDGVPRTYIERWDPPFFDSLGTVSELRLEAVRLKDQLSDHTINALQLRAAARDLLENGTCPICFHGDGTEDGCEPWCPLGQANRLLSEGRVLVHQAMEGNHSRGVPDSVPFMVNAEDWMKKTIGGV